MSVCTFFGHHNCPAAIKPKLRAAIIELIEHESVNMFYVGNHGAFDGMVRSVQRELKPIYPEINYAVVLAYMPQKRDELDDREHFDTMLPEGIEEAPPRFAISWRNRWMLHRADYVVTCVTHSWGGAAQFAAMAERQKKNVIRL